MKKKILSGLLAAGLIISTLAGCGTAGTSETGSAGAGGAVSSDTSADSAQESSLEDGTYTVDVTLEGGSGRASIDSPTTITVKDGEITAEIVWSSNHYDYMIVDGEKYEPVTTDPTSKFEIPISGLDEPVSVTADTTAMSKPYEIDYTLTFDPDSLQAVTADWNDLQKAGSMQLEYADQFQVDYYTASGAGDKSGRASDLQAASSDAAFSASSDASGDAGLSQNAYALITISGVGRFLVVPEGLPVPDGDVEDFLSEISGDASGSENDTFSGLTILQKPFSHVYLASSSTMDFWDKLGVLDAVKMTSTEEEDWSLEDVQQAMESGDMTYVGKYSAPDYEQILAENCDLVVENTMIYHKPETLEKLESLGIPVIIDKSSYESHPMGRLEWIRLYGLLSGRQQAADEFFAQQEERFNNIVESAHSGKKAAFFYVLSNGSVNVRKAGDYISRMIEMAGGTYAFADLSPDEENALSTVNMQMESFYEGAKDADILIYNATVTEQLDDLQDLLDKSDLFSDFKAVQNGDVWCTKQDMYQQTTGICDTIEDFYKVINEEDVSDDELHYLYRLK